MPTRCPQQHTAWPGEVRQVAVAMLGKLDGTETCAGTPTVSVSSTNITISGTAVNTTALTVEGSTYSVGQVIQFKVTTTDGTGGARYSMIATTTTSLSQVLNAHMMLTMETTT